MKITTNAGATYEGTPPQIVCFLWKDAFVSETTVDRYMHAVAGRLAALGSEPPRCGVALEFLKDLDKLTIITIDRR